MPPISPEFLIRSFQQLTNTQEDMQSLSLFIRLNKSEHLIVLDIYERELEKSNVHHKLTLYYLANEILQTERDRDDDAIGLIDGLKRCVMSTFKNTIVEATGDLKTNYDKLKKVWITRKIFNQKEIGGMEENNSKNRFGRDELLKRIDKFYDEKEELKNYLKEFIDHLEEK